MSIFPAFKHFKYQPIKSTLFHTAKFSIMVIFILIIIIIWLWNVPQLAMVVEKCTYSDDCTCPLWAEAYFAMQDMKTTFHLANSSLHTCIFVCYMDVNSKQ